jgi:leucyl aminopeptidase (aminopeptidase T)
MGKSVNLVSPPSTNLVIKMMSRKWLESAGDQMQTPAI